MTGHLVTGLAALLILSIVIEGRSFSPTDNHPLFEEVDIGSYFKTPWVHRNILVGRGVS
jgi:hypothetical protein